MDVVFFFWSWFLAALLLAIAAACVSGVRIRRVLCSSVWLLSLMNLVGAGLWTWALRDGLGPDAVDSYGGLAVQRFASVYWITFLVGVLPIVVASMFSRAGKMKRKAA